MIQPFQNDAPADVCLLLEGTYPYVAGGVSSWVHDLIRAQSHLTFTLVCIVPKTEGLQQRYDLPPNVVGLQHIPLHGMPKGRRLPPRGFGKLMRRIGVSLEAVLQGGGIHDLARLNALIAPHRKHLGRRHLLDSEAAWELVLDIYERSMPAASFMDYFWTWRCLAGSLFSVLLADLPAARCYHSVSTGYAGLLAARARIETDRPAFITEHGIYTNERRIEISMADWLFDARAFGLAVKTARRDLRDVWISAFVSISRACYAACDPIVTLFTGNQVLQREDGAPPEKLRVIPNGIDFERFSAIPRRRPDSQRPTIALIGRVVPVKDVKTFLRACAMIRETIPDLHALVMGPTEEDEVYHQECLSLQRLLRLEGTVEFTGRVRIDDYFDRLDVLVLTSISEAQPLVVLEAGAAGIPSVSTDVGSCRELILGRIDEEPRLSPGGAVTPLANPAATAQAIAQLLADPAVRNQAGEAMRERVRRYYDKRLIDQIYGQLYDELVARPDTALVLPPKEADSDGEAA